MPKYNLNRKKWTKVVLLFLALSFAVVPLITLIVHVIALMD